MNERFLRALPVLPVALMLAGCTVVGREAMVARLEVAAAPSCATTPDLAGATAMTKKGKDEPHVATVRFADTAACLNDASGSRGVYAVVDLPAGAPGDIVTVTSYAMGTTIFSPRLEFRDAQGTMLRQIGRETFLFNGPSLQTQLRRREGERFLVIASDNLTVGKTSERIQASVNHGGVPIGAAYIPINTGAEATSKFTFAHNGEVTVTLAPVPKDK